jgi:GPH family glycoside/pentoside/hexuronide:cation symporter
MVADICDEEELHTGLRREGMYGAVTGFALKVSLAITALSGGILLEMSGYNAATAEAVGSVPMDVIFKLRTLYIGVQAAALVVAIVLFYFYPLDRARAENVRRQLDQHRRGESPSPQNPSLAVSII